MSALRAASRAAERERPLLRSHWASVEVEDDDASVRALRERMAAYEVAGLDRLILAFPKDCAAEMVQRTGSRILHAVARA